MKKKTTDSTAETKGFVQLNRSEDAEQLLARYPKAFCLLTLIAIRARRDSEPCKWTKLKQGQAMLGDHKSCGLSEQEYRTAKKQLSAAGLATFSATNKGTIATLCSSSVYNINAEKDNEQINKQATDDATGKQQVELQGGVKWA
jgi:hypothetical protein